jgi:hypothetical protein
MTSEKQYAAEAIDRMFPRVPATLYEVAWQYSLFDWYDTRLSGEIDFELSPEHLSYMTPRAKSELFGESDSLVVVSVDLSDPDNPQLAGNGDSVYITTYTEADRFRIGHSYPANKTSNMTDYSITTYKSASAHHIAGLRDDAWGTNNVQDRFTDWAQSEPANTVRDRVEPEEQDIIDGLAKLGDDDAAMEKLSDALLDEAGGEDVEIDALITVRIRLPGEDTFHYPGEIPVLNEVMLEKKSERFESISVEDASGEGTGYLSTDRGRVTGGSPGLFGMFGKKQREHFPDLDDKGTSAWRSRPIDFETAAAVAAADSIFDDFYRGLGGSRRLYVLPYLVCRPTECAPEELSWFIDTVFRPLRDAEDEFDEIVEEVMRKSSSAASGDVQEETMFGDVAQTEAWDTVRIATVHQVSGNPDRVFFNSLDASYRPAQLEDAHNDVVQEVPFRDNGIFATSPPSSSSPLLGQGLKLNQYILYGGYFDRTTEPTRSSREANETPTVGDIDDYRMRRVRQFLTGETMSAHELLEHYLHKLVQEQNEQFGNDSDYSPVPVRSIVEQYVQIHALESVGALHSERGTIPQFTIDKMTDNPSSRDERLEQFLDSHGALSEQHHRATFLLGALVGRITAYQSREGISSTLVRRYPIGYPTKQTIKQVTKEVLQQDAEYAEAEERRSHWTNSRYTVRLTDTMLSSDPTTWPITDAELQWLYGLGIAYGLNDTSTEDQSVEKNSETASLTSN